MPLNLSQASLEVLEPSQLLPQYHLNPDASLPGFTSLPGYHTAPLHSRVVSGSGGGDSFMASDPDPLDPHLCLQPLTPSDVNRRDSHSFLTDSQPTTGRAASGHGSGRRENQSSHSGLLAGVYRLLVFGQVPLSAV